MSDAAEKKKWWKKRWVIWTIVVPGLVGGVVGGAIFWLSYNEKSQWLALEKELVAQGEIFDASQFYPPQVVDEDNALKDDWFLELLERAENNAGLHAEVFGVDAADIHDLDYLEMEWEGPDWNEGHRLLVAQKEETKGTKKVANLEAARALLRSLDANGSMSTELKRVMKLPVFRSDDPATKKEFFEERYSEQIELCRIFSRVAIMRSMLGEKELAVEALENALALTEWTRANNLLIAQLVEITCEGIVQAAVWQLIADNAEDTEMLEVIGNLLDDCDNDRDDMLIAIRAETASMVSMVQAMEPGDWVAVGGMGFSKPSPGELLSGHLLNSDLVKHRILRFYVERTIRPLIAYEKLSPRPPMTELARMMDSAGSARVASSNPISERLEKALGLFLVSYDRFIENEVATQTGWEILQVQLAIRKFQNTEGRLPNGFDELVPNYLKSVPQDPFDQTPLKWAVDDLGEPVIYSVGKDGVDDGGQITEVDGMRAADFGALLSPRERDGE